MQPFMFGLGDWVPAVTDRQTSFRRPLLGLLVGAKNTQKLVKYLQVKSEILSGYSTAQNKGNKKD